MQICDYKYDCTGCGACMSLCPVHCISLTQNIQGFLEPDIDHVKCIGCGKCKKNCPSNVSKKQNYSIDRIETYSFTTNHNEILKESSSGGAFTAIAKEIINREGIVFGAAFDENLNVVHTGIDKAEDLYRLRGSKYVQSNTQNTYSKAKEALREGQPVLFVGTPCQIAGLYASLEYKEYENLYTIDLLCHGVPSTALFRSYLDYLESKYGKIVRYSFRDKTKFGWGNWGSFVYWDKNGREHKKDFVVATDYYYSLYFQECNFRESCYKCKYASIPRIGDITIGDCWGIENVDPDADLKNGVSLVIINNTKGKELIVSSLKNEVLKLLNTETMIKFNPTIIDSSKRPGTRDTFYTDFMKYGFENTAKRYCKLKKAIPVSRYLPIGLKRNIKKALRKCTK